MQQVNRKTAAAAAMRFLQKTSAALSFRQPLPPVMVIKAEKRLKRHSVFMQYAQRQPVHPIRRPSREMGKSNPAGYVAVLLHLCLAHYTGN